VSKKSDRYYEEKLDLLRDEGIPLRRFTSTWPVDRKERDMQEQAEPRDNGVKFYTPEQKSKAREKYVQIATETQAAIDIEPKEFNARVGTRIKEVELDSKDPHAWVTAAEWVSQYCIEDEERICKARAYKQRLRAAVKPVRVKPAALPAVAPPPPKQEAMKVQPASQQPTSQTINLEGIYELPEVLLVGGQISKPGDVRYERLDEDSTEKREGDIIKGERTRTTRRVIRDTEGHKAATELVGKLNNELRKICATSPFGRVCRVDREPALREFIKSARERALEHNQSVLGRFHRVEVNLLPGMITQDSERAARTLVKEMQGLFDEVQRGLDACDVEAIREAATRIKSLGTVFPASQQKALDAAVKGARRVARTLVREVEKKGRTIADVKRELDASPVSVARMKFLSMPSDAEADLKVEKAAPSKRFDKSTDAGPVEVKPAVNANRFAKPE
jgi:hypothetical protein